MLRGVSFHQYISKNSVGAPGLEFKGRQTKSPLTGRVNMTGRAKRVKLRSHAAPAAVLSPLITPGE